MHCKWSIINFHNNFAYLTPHIAKSDCLRTKATPYGACKDHYMINHVTFSPWAEREKHFLLQPFFSSEYLQLLQLQKLLLRHKRSQLDSYKLQNPQEEHGQCPVLTCRNHGQREILMLKMIFMPMLINDDSKFTRRTFICNG